MKNKKLILNPFFLSGLALLLLNDFYFKYEYSNATITGKLSDFAGLLIFPMFFAFLFLRISKSISFITGVAFIIWKLPLFTPVVNLINQIPYISIHRVIDYTDYIALLILPLSHYLINHHKFKVSSNKLVLKGSFPTYTILAVAFFAFCATSAPRYFPYEKPKGTIYIDKSYIIKLPKDSIINSIKRLGYNCDYYERDTLKINSISYYQTDNIIRGERIRKDTIANVKYEIIELKPNKTRVRIINVTLPQEGQMQDWKELKAVSNQYYYWLKDNLIEKD